MLRFLRALSPKVEFAIVVGVAFGYIILVSIAVAVHPRSGPHHTNGSLIGLVVFETILMAVLFPLLRIRGWSFAKIGLAPTLRDTGVGLLLALAFYALWTVLWVAIVLFSHETAQRMAETRIVAQGIPLATIVLVSPVNAFFEEVFVCGYVMTALHRKENVWFALNASVAIRLLYHLYQGPLGVLSVIPFGLIFGYWYARTGRLWPVIVAHSAIDVVGMLAAGH
jgi:membrane protease YdiL (CAAX protease family)